MNLLLCLELNIADWWKVKILLWHFTFKSRKLSEALFTSSFQTGFPKYNIFITVSTKTIICLSLGDYWRIFTLMPCFSASTTITWATEKCLDWGEGHDFCANKYNMYSRRYADVNKHIEEMEESYSQCKGAEHRIKVQLYPMVYGENMYWNSPKHLMLIYTILSLTTSLYILVG